MVFPKKFLTFRWKTTSSAPEWEGDPVVSRRNQTQTFENVPLLSSGHPIKLLSQTFAGTVIELRPRFVENVINSHFVTGPGHRRAIVPISRSGNCFRKRSEIGFLSTAATFQYIILRKVWVCVFVACFVWWMGAGVNGVARV